MPRLTTIIDSLSEELMNLEFLEEGRAKYQDGEEVTRKDGRIFKKVSGKWVYQRKAKGSPGDAPPPSPDAPTPPAEEPKPPRFRRPKKEPAPPKDPDAEKVEAAFKKLAGRARRIPMGSITQDLLDAGMDKDVVATTIKKMMADGDFRAAYEKVGGRPQYMLIRNTPAEKEKGKAEKERKDQEEKAREQERAEREAREKERAEQERAEKERKEKEEREAREKEEKENKEKEEKRQKAIAEFPKVFKESFQKLLSSGDKVGNVHDLRQLIMKSTGMDLKDYHEQYVKLLATGEYQEYTWKNMLGFTKIGVARIPPKTAPPPKAPPPPPAPKPAPPPAPPKAPPPPPKPAPPPAAPPPRPGPPPGPVPPPSNPPTPRTPGPPPVVPPPKAPPPPPKAPPTKEEPKPEKPWKEHRQEVAARNPVPKFKDIQEAERWATSKHPHVTWEMKKTHPELAHAAIEVVHHLAQDFPEVMNSIKYMGSDASGMRKRDPVRKYRGSRWSPSVYAHASKFTGELGINPHHFKDPKKMAESMAADVKVGFHPKGCEAPAAIVTHEFGHHVDYVLESAKDHFMFPGIPVSTQSIHIAFMSQVKATRDLSAYAMKNSKEGFAEGFSMRHHGDPDQWPDYVKRQHMWLNTYIKRQGQAKNEWEMKTAMGTMSKEEKDKAKAEFSSFLKGLGIRLPGY